MEVKWKEANAIHNKSTAQKSRSTIKVLNSPFKKPGKSCLNKGAWGFQFRENTEQY